MALVLDGDNQSKRFKAPSIGLHQCGHAVCIAPDKGQLFILTRKRFGGLVAQVQNQHAGLTGPAIAGVLPDAVDEGQSPVGQAGFQRLLPRFVFRVAQLLGKRVPCGDERSAQGLALGHQLFKVRARYADVHRERRFMVDDVVGFGEGLKKFGGQLAGHGDGFG